MQSETCKIVPAAQGELHRVTYDGLIIVAATFISNLGSYLYQLVMGIMLSPASYGIFSSLIALLAMILLLPNAITTITAKYVSAYKSREAYGNIRNAWRKFLLMGLLLGAGLFLVMLALTPLVTRLLHLENGYYSVIIFSSFIFCCVVAVNQGVLQGLNKFVGLGITRALGGVFKVLLGALFVWLGWNVGGALWAMPLSFALVLVISYPFLRHMRRYPSEKSRLNGLASYSGLSFLGSFCLTTMTRI
jgi:O-antigen/teichoic acid export membrane protein